MEQLSNLDVIILIIVALSALLAFYRGLIKEVLSIIGWVIMTALMIYVLPLLVPIFAKYIESGMMAGIATAVTIFVVFFIIWFIFTAYISGKIRSLKKLNFIDRTLGLFFGIIRAGLFVVLTYIAIGWIVPFKEQPEFLTKSKYYVLAGSFAKPIEDLIPQDTLNLIKSKDDAKSKETEEKVQKEIDDLFKKLAQPTVKSEKDTDKKDKDANDTGYSKKERDNLDRLIENIVEE